MGFFYFLLKYFLWQVLRLSIKVIFCHNYFYFHSSSFSAELLLLLLKYPKQIVVSSLQKCMNETDHIRLTKSSLRRTLTGRFLSVVWMPSSRIGCTCLLGLLPMLPPAAFVTCRAVVNLAHKYLRIPTTSCVSDSASSKSPEDTRTRSNQSRLWLASTVRLSCPIKNDVTVL